jgi:hypothetical protein
MSRQMANAEYRQHQWEHRYDDHIAPINHFVDEINEPEGLVAPYVAPIYGGVKARMLSVLRDPGRMANQSGFLSIENNDATAETMYGLLAEAEIKVPDMVPWNAYPWYINGNPNAAQVNAGVEPLIHIIDLLPMLQVVILHGGTAHDSWRRLTLNPHGLDIIANRGLQIIETYHTSRQAFRHPDEAVREYRRQHIRDSLQMAAHILCTERTAGPLAADA